MSPDRAGNSKLAVGVAVMVAAILALFVLGEVRNDKAIRAEREKQTQMEQKFEAEREAQEASVTADSALGYLRTACSNSKGENKRLACAYIEKINAIPEASNAIPGPQGSSGPPGPTGPVGPFGPRGFKGENGNPGTEGAEGAGGADGVNGGDGVDGTDGAVGPVGPEGPQGVQGPRGEQGPRVQSFTFTDQTGTTYRCTDPEDDGSYACQEQPPEEPTP